ncbi:MAG: hypothetical protein ACLUFN_04345 [Eubacterium sp.]
MKKESLTKLLFFIWITLYFSIGNISTLFFSEIVNYIFIVFFMIFDVFLVVLTVKSKSFIIVNLIANVFLAFPYIIQIPDALIFSLVNDDYMGTIPNAIYNPIYSINNEFVFFGFIIICIFNVLMIILSKRKQKTN